MLNIILTVNRLVTAADEEKFSEEDAFKFVFLFGFVCLYSNLF